MSEEEQNGIAWYKASGIDRDVIISSKVRLARNLANFSFPVCFKNDEAERVQSIVFDAFTKTDDSGKLHFVRTDALTQLNHVILEERGVLKSFDEKRARRIPCETGLVMTSDGKSYAIINGEDHVHISVYSSGLNFRNTYEQCKKMDDSLQQYLQFAATCDFGYLTSAIRSLGSGMKVSARIHIPAIVKTGKFEQIIKYLSDNKFSIAPAFPVISQKSPAGCYFTIYNNTAFNGSEIDQIADIEAICKFIVETERKISTEYADNRKTIVRNSIYRAYSLAKMSLLVSLRESIDIISDFQFGLKYGFLNGIDNDELCSLLYRVQPAHLNYLMENGNFSFDDDVKDEDVLKNDRLRAIIMQEAFEKISLEKL